MNASATMPFKVLFVDDDRAFLDMARQAFADMSGGTWEVSSAIDAPSTSAALRQQSFDLIVLDVRMPEISGLQLIGILQREYPEIPKVFLAAVVEESDRLTGLASGASLFLEKPANYSGMQSIFATLNELLKWRHKQGSSGAPSHAGLLDLVKLECSAGHSRIFEVSNADTRGLIYIREGAIVHAECPGRRGQSAFSHLTTLLDAEFSLRQFTEPAERSVLRQWEFLYLEAVQLREQLLQVAEEAKAKARQVEETQKSAVPAAPAPTPPEAPVTRPPETPAVQAREPAPPSVAPAPAPPPGVPRVTDEEATRQLFRRPGVAVSAPGKPAAEAPPLKPAPASPETPAAAPAGPPAEAPPPAPAEELLQLRMMRPEFGPAGAGGIEEKVSPPPATGLPLEEMLVCSYSAEVLYEWQCPRTNSRLQLVETARERSERLSQHLPLGPVDRLEMQATAGRLLIHFQEDGAIFLRSGSGEQPGDPGPGLLHQSMAGWLARHANIPGLLAAGVIRPNQQTVSQSTASNYPREPLSVAWRCVQEVFELSAKHELPAWQLRWVYEQAQLYAVQRQDGKALAMFLSKDPAILDSTAIEKVFREFRSLTAA